MRAESEQEAEGGAAEQEQGRAGGAAAEGDGSGVVWHEGKQPG